MSRIYFEIGLTDKTYEGLYHDTSQDEYIAKRLEEDSVTELRYNVRSMDPDLEKFTVRWELLDNEVTKGVMNAWEHTVQIPHLNMVSWSEWPTVMAPDMKSFEFKMHYKHLIPFKSFEVDDVSEADMKSSLRGKPQFGELYLNKWDAIGHMDYDHTETIEYAQNQDTVEHLARGPIQWKTAPVFTAQFVLGQTDAPNYHHHPIFQKFLDDNKEQLIELGHDPDSHSLKYNAYMPIGTLITDPMEVINAVEKYNIVCRQAITVED